MSWREGVSKMRLYASSLYQVKVITYYSMTGVFLIEDVQEV